MERKRVRTVVSKEAYEAIDKSVGEGRKPGTPLSVQFLDKGELRMLVFFFPTETGGGRVPVAVPVDTIEELKEAKLADLRKARLSPSHAALIVDGVDAFVSVNGLIRDFWESVPSAKTLIAQMFAAKGGKATSEAKKRASAENGKNGGRRPTKEPERAVASGKPKLA